jgi:hypothetical protein
MDAIDLNEERRTEERQAELRAKAVTQAGLVLCPSCGRPIEKDDLRRCDATSAEGNDCRRQGCRRQGCRHCMTADSAGNLYCCPACGLDVYRELIAFEERSHQKLLAWYRERIAVLEKTS